MDKNRRRLAVLGLISIAVLVGFIFSVAMSPPLVRATTLELAKQATSSNPGVGRETQGTATSTPSPTASPPYASYLPLVSRNHLPPTPAATPSPTPGRLERVGQVGGWIRSFSIRGRYAYAGVGTALVIIDVLDPGQAREVSRVAVSGLVSAVAVDNGYAYVATDDFRPDGSALIHIIHIQDPLQPQEVATHRVEGGHSGGNILHARISDLAISNRVLFIAAGQAGLALADIANPRAPQAISVTLPDSYSWRVEYLATKGNLLFATDTTTLHILDASNPAMPIRLAGYNPGGLFADPAVEGEYAYLPFGDQVDIIRIADPASPTRVGGFATVGLVVSVSVARSHLYLVSEQGGLQIVDVTIPSAPRLLGELGLVGNRVVVDGSYAYLAVWPGGLQILDIRNATAPRQAGAYMTVGNALSLAVSGHYAYVADGDFHVLDLRDPTMPRVVGSVATRGRAFAVAVEGSYAYVADDQNGLLILDVSDPTQPREVGLFALPTTWLTSVVAQNGVAYVGAGNPYIHAPTLYLVDVSNPAQPQELARVMGGSLTNAVVVADGIAYLADDGGLRTQDVSNPRAPRRLADVDWIRGNDLFLVGHTLYVAGSTADVQVVDVSDPGQPTEIGRYDGPASYFMSIWADETRALVGEIGTGPYALHMLDVSDPTHPTQVEQVTLSSLVFDIAVSGCNVVVANGTGGVQVFRQCQATTSTVQP